MSFREPALLAALALVPLAVAAYVYAQRRGERYAVKYTNVEVLAGVTRRAPLRHLPALLALLALASLGVAVAQPKRSVAAERREGVVMLAIDTSDSMKATDVKPDRLRAAQAAARVFTDKLPDDFRLGLVRFSKGAEQALAPTTDRGSALASIGALETRLGTAMGEGLKLSLEAARAPVAGVNGQTRKLPAAIVLLSDGKQTDGTADPLAIAREAKKAKVPIHAIALGSASGVLRKADGSTEPVPPDTATLRQVAQITGGRFFATADPAQLKSIYSGLSTAVATRKEDKELTAAFAGGALALLLLGGALGYGRMGRLP